MVKSIANTINKMNKTKSSKSTSQSQLPMRVLFKMRTNPKAAMRTLEDESRIEDLPNKSVAVVSEEPEDSLEQRYGHSRMRTEYSDRFGLFRKNNHSFHHVQQRPQQVEADGDNSSVISASKSYSRISLAPLREEADRKTIESRKEEQRLPEIREAPANFEQIEDKIQSLMRRRLGECVQFKKRSDWVIDDELSQLVQAYKDIRGGSNPEVQEEDVGLLSRRIAMLEKLIAENMAESDIVKKYYLGKVAKQHWKHHKTESFATAEPVRTQENEPRQQALVNTSNNRDSYQQPERAAYSLERPGNPFFNADRHKQPLPRSSYNRDFLTYGPVQSMSSCKPVENECLKAASSAKVMNSSYRSNFVAKKAEKVNIRELDACRDKIKNLPIIFGKREKDVIVSNMAAFFRLRNHPQQQANPHVQTQEPSQPNPHHFTSESRREFVAGVQVSASQIKHRNLQRLKYHLKKEMHM